MCTHTCSTPDQVHEDSNLHPSCKRPIGRRNRRTLALLQQDRDDGVDVAVREMKCEAYDVPFRLVPNRLKRFSGSSIHQGADAQSAHILRPAVVEQHLRVSQQSAFFSQGSWRPAQPPNMPLNSSPRNALARSGSSGSDIQRGLSFIYVPPPVSPIIDLTWEAKPRHRVQMRRHRRDRRLPLRCSNRSWMLNSPGVRPSSRAQIYPHK